MKKVILFILTIVVSSKFVAANEVVLHFSDITLDAARKKASAEGKLLFVDFHAKWCTPCKWMEQTTFKDEDIISTLNSDFVSIKVDIDDITGYESKKSFDVKYLPTMLIFNAQGQLIERIEETMSPRMLKSVLDKHNILENKIVGEHALNTSPSDLANPAEVTPGNTQANPSDNASPVTPQRDPMLMSPEDYRTYFNTPQTQSSYKVQVGVFSTYDAASNHVEKLKEIFLEPITVISEMRDGEAIFKVRMGQFASYDEAESFRVILQNDFKIPGIVQ
jgi:thioredoxin 1